MSGEVQFDALVDSGASHNFVSQLVVAKYGWQLNRNRCMPVRLADGTVMQTKGMVEGLTRIGAWMAVVEY